MCVHLFIVCVAIICRASSPPAPPPSPPPRPSWLTGSKNLSIIFTFLFWMVPLSLGTLLSFSLGLRRVLIPSTPLLLLPSSLHFFLPALCLWHLFLSTLFCVWSLPPHPLTASPPAHLSLISLYLPLYMYTLICWVCEHAIWFKISDQSGQSGGGGGSLVWWRDNNLRLYSARVCGMASNLLARAGAMALYLTAAA